MAEIKTIKNPVELRKEIKSNGTCIEYIVIDGIKCGILGSVSEADREAALRVLNKAYIASGGDIMQMIVNLDTIAALEDKKIDPDEVVAIQEEEFIISYAKKTAYTMRGDEVANCKDLTDMPKEAVKAVLVARIEALIK
jgi:hypothetical protein